MTELLIFSYGYGATMDSRGGIFYELRLNNFMRAEALIV